MTRILVLLAAAVTAFPAAAYAQAGTAAQSAEPFKVGTFLIGNAERVGIVLRDALVVDLAQANAALQKSRSFPPRTMPSDMVALISDYENGLKGRIYAIVNDLVQGKALEGTRPDYVRELSQVRTLAPIPRPRMMMMTAVNFYSHINENGTPEERAKAIAARKANRGVPYMFLKAPSSVIGTGRDHPDSAWSNRAGLGDRAGAPSSAAGRGMSPPRRPRIMCSATPSCSTSRIAAGGRRADSAAAPTGS